jgi:16S rRNA (guanine(1405)-N(7))-methyltransferase
MDRFFKDQGLPVSVSYNDLFISVPEHGSEDLVMLLKTLPCLEQQEKGISEKLLAQMTCDQLIISFPAKSLGGKEKGMVESYRAFLMELIAGSGYGLKGVVPFENETVYVLGKSRE